MLCNTYVELTVPSAAPDNLMASSITMSASITVTWEPVPCMYRNGVITGYVIRYRELNNDSVSVETITRDMCLRSLD